MRIFFEKKWVVVRISHESESNRILTFQPTAWDKIQIFSIIFHFRIAEIVIERSVGKTRFKEQSSFSILLSLCKLDALEYNVLASFGARKEFLFDIRTMAAKKRKNPSSNGNRAKISSAGGGNSSCAEEDDRFVSSMAQKKSGGINQLTIYGAAILVLAIISGLLMNKNDAAKNSNENDDTTIHPNLTVDASFGAFWNNICGDSNNSRSRSHAWCGNGSVEPTRRTLQAATTKNKPIRRGDVVVEIPRELQIWEIDALKSDLVQKEKLVRARHKMTENSLASGAFLATYLATERKRLVTNENETDRTNGSAIDEMRASYFRSLPSWEELSAYHPILKSRSDLQSMLGHHSWNFAVVVMYQEMVNSEYEALATASPLVFGRQISLKEYQASRIHVLSRSFNPGSGACSSEAEKFLSSNALEKLQSDWGIQISEGLFDEGCHAMVPILDTLNSHPHPNVVYDYHSGKRAFVITAKSGIHPQWELMNSYGKFSDSHLYAKFGFVNGDGSGYTQVSIALFHRPLDVQMSQEYSLVPNKIKYDSRSDDSFSPTEKIPDFQKVNMKRYLMYDDGYDSCVQKDLHPEAFKLKWLKWQHLAKITNNPKFWVATLKPRLPKSHPRQSSNLLIREVPPEVNPQKLGLDMTNLVDTCRLLALTVDDFEGKAIDLLNENLGNDTFVVPKGSQALEYRSLMFMARLSGMALMQYPVNIKKEYQNALQLNKENAFGNSTWTSTQLRLGEMQVRSYTIISCRS